MLQSKESERLLNPTISKEEVNRLPLIRYSGKVEVVANCKDVSTALKSIRQEKLLGFDTETRPTFRKGENHHPALVQLATSDAVYLFQLQRLASLSTLMELLSNGAITKAGVAIENDIRKLNQLCPFTPSGFIELSTLSKQIGIKNTGLRNLAAIVLNFRVSKGAQITNWSRNELTDSQILYAATDAWICRLLYIYLAPRVDSTPTGTSNEN
ncbi:MAG: Ribonuclease D [Candidatus Moanabacter tarae]|uniref:3'-5' exonuclease n=1 Tax=Candidatus Moanibacter tarae TaxID=2200854 RepID=A0A2Z4AJ90_9BACT|nr:MAG: Ribonuclease D [Candidatus Moanabacter tarae]|tara:strand:+ start:8153 stop:8788 length:636 start_codon:yes stop_codon:yes gene_type:complete